MRAVGLVFLLGSALATLPRPVAAAPEVHFSPHGGVRDRLLREINHTKSSIDLAIFDFTSGELAGALLAAHGRGVAIRIVADTRQARGKHSEVSALLAGGLDVRFAPGNGRRGVMHHKFAVFDHAMLVTGSYNWTEAAERANFENALFLDDPGLVTEYAVLFQRLFEGATRTSSAHRPTVVGAAHQRP
jgi:phosphatidylserine/phosphatidylglycerophosphate/cardiolipin synthase-like enzyme